MGQPTQEQQVWTDPGPAVNYAVAIVAFSLFAVWTGMVKPEGAILLIPPMLSAAITPLICGIIDYKRGSVLTGTLGMVFGGILGFGGVAQVMVYAWTAKEGIPIDPSLSGFMWSAAGVILILIGLVAMRLSWLFFVMLVEVGVGILLNGLSLWQIAPAVLAPLSGWLVLIFAIWCLYSGTAILVNTQARRLVLPLGEPMIKD
jgi:succinate-acetate transporter protein